MNATLTIICGPMFAGKTTLLIKRVQDWESSGGEAIVIKPKKDDRYQRLAKRGNAHARHIVTHVITHDGVALGAFNAANASQVASKALGGLHVLRGIESQPKPTLIAIDEAHFFGRSLSKEVIRLLKHDLHVILAGVDLDHRGDPFEPFPSLLAHADEVIKLASRCQVCNAPARHSQRMSAGDSRIEVGGSDKYEARCRNCFKPKHAARP
ncbi:MAG: hypothetical protein U0640_06430 [Phycisphaerales bacterium]